LDVRQLYCAVFSGVDQKCSIGAKSVIYDCLVSVWFEMNDVNTL